MKKKNFVSMVLGTVGGILFAIGMCMCLLPEWGAFTQGVIIAAVGIVVLLAMLLVRRKMEGKPAVKLNGRAVITMLIGVVGALAFGVGMCMSMVWGMMIPGIGRDIWDRDIALSDPKDKRTGTVKAEWQIYDKEGSQWLNRSWLKQTKKSWKVLLKDIRR